MALGTQVVNLIRLNAVDHAAQRIPIREVPIMEEELRMLVGIHVEVIDAVGIESGCAADDAVDLVALAQQQLHEVAAVLACDAGDKCY